MFVALPILSLFFRKFTELFAWFKQFLGHKEGRGSESESESLSQQLAKEKHEGIAMEIGIPRN